MMSVKLEDDLFTSSDFFQNPYKYYDYLQHHHPVYWSEKLESWIVTRYSDVEQGLLDQAFSSKRSRIEAMPMQDQVRLKNLRKFYSNWLMFCDPPKHTDLRRPVVQAITKDIITRVCSEVKIEARELISKIKPRRRIDVVSEYVSKLSISAICSFVGVPKDDSGTIHQWSQDIVSFLGAKELTLKHGLRAQESMSALIGYIERIRKSDKSINPNSLLGSLFSSKRSESQEYKELLVVVANILIDGHEPITATTTSALLSMSNHELLGGRPCLTPEFVEELIRYEPPFQYVARITLRDTQIGTKKIEAGERTIFMLGATNKDGCKFKDPNSLLSEGRTTRNLTFGHGIHHCLGIKLAKPVVTDILSVLLDALSPIEILPSTIQWIPSIGYRSLVRLDIKW